MIDNTNSIMMSGEPASPNIKKYALEYMRKRPDHPISLKEIKMYVFEKTGENFSGGSYSGAIRDLVDEMDGRIVNVDRGVYIYLGNIKAYEINRAIDDLVEKLNEIAYVNILTTSDQDLDVIRKIPHIQERVQRLKVRYSSRGERF